MAYAEVEELARILKIRSPSDEQTAAMNRVLAMSTVEIDKEIDRAEDAEELTEDETSLLEEVNLERAVELWNESPFGILGIGAETGVAYASKDSWQRYANKLAPLKDQWGFA